MPNLSAKSIPRDNSIRNGAVLVRRDKFTIGKGPTPLFLVYFAENAYKESLPTIQKMLGHKRLTTTERYVQTLRDGQRQDAEKLIFQQKLPPEAPTKI
jgi:hypothetical protein